jgi:hypothetical protein
MLLTNNKGLMDYVGIHLKNNGFYQSPNNIKTYINDNYNLILNIGPIVNGKIQLRVLYDPVNPTTKLIEYDYNNHIFQEFYINEIEPLIK